MSRCSVIFALLSEVRGIGAPGPHTSRDDNCRWRCRLSIHGHAPRSASHPGRQRGKVRCRSGGGEGLRTTHCGSGSSTTSWQSGRWITETRLFLHTCTLQDTGAVLAASRSASLSLQFYLRSVADCVDELHRLSGRRLRRHQVVVTMNPNQHVPILWIRRRFSQKTNPVSFCLLIG